jgi:hypothetical protein
VVYLGVVVEGQAVETVADELGDVVRVRLLMMVLGSRRPQALAVALQVLLRSVEEGPNVQPDWTLVVFLLRREDLEGCHDVRPLSHIPRRGVVPALAVSCGRFLPFRRSGDDEV